MPFIKTVVSQQNPAVKITVELPDGISDTEKLIAVSRAQRFVNTFESVEQFDVAMEALGEEELEN